MSHSKDNKGGKQRAQDSPPESAESDKRSGRASFDSRGNSVWEWQLETGVYSRDVNTQKLKKLDLGELSIADSGIHQQPRSLAPDQPNVAAPARAPPAPKKAAAATPVKMSQPPASSKGGGFNPYDTSNRDTGNRHLGGGGGTNPYDSQGRPPPGAGTNPYDQARALGNRFNPEAPQPERRRTPADLRKLDQLIKEQRKKGKE